MRHRAWMSKLGEEEEIAHKSCMDEISRLQQQSKDTHAMLMQLKGILDQAKLDNESKKKKNSQHKTLPLLSRCYLFF